MRKYIRSEREDLFDPNVYISMIVKLEGDISLEQVREAIEAAYASNESTMSRIVLEDNGTAYYEKMDKTGCKIFCDNRKWQDILKESEKKPFALWNGELIRTYINKSENNVVIYIMAHHLVGDGKSIIYFIKDILRKLSGENLSFKPMNLVDEKLLEKKAKLLIPIKLWINGVNKKWQKVGKTFNWEDYLNIHNKYWSNRGSEIIIEEYDETEISKMKQYCKDGITLNSYLITCLSKKYKDCKVIGIPISIRDGDISMSNQTSGIAINHSYCEDKSFEYNLMKIHKKISWEMNNNRKKYFILPFMASINPSLLDAVLLESQGCYSNKVSMKFAKSIGYLDKKYTDLGVTNLTVIDIPNKFHNFEVNDIYFIPPKISYSEVVIGIATFNNKLKIIKHDIKMEI